MKHWIAAAYLLAGIGLLSQGAFAQQLQDGMVTVPVQVADSAGQPILDLQSKHLRILEDSIEQKIRTFAKGDSDGAYIIRYYPAQNPNTGYHAIQVMVRLPGVRLRARPGFYPPAQN